MSLQGLNRIFRGAIRGGKSGRGTVASTVKTGTSRQAVGGGRGIAASCGRSIGLTSFFGLMFLRSQFRWRILKFLNVREGSLMIRMITGWLSSILETLEWLIMTMDVTQWGIVSTIFVVLGFFALRTRI